MQSGKIKDTFIIGFAIFAMFFGAGNLIFPPFLGLMSGANWFLSFLCFIGMDIGLSILALLVVTKIGRGAEGITEKLGRKSSFLILSLNVICLGPLIAIPRTAATAYEFAITPFFPTVSSGVFSIIFFIIVVLFCLKQSKIIDIIGMVFAPLMLAALAVLIIKGVTTPLGEVAIKVSAGTAMGEGIMSGYQTMDVMAAVLFSAVILLSVTKKGYTSKKQQFKMVSAAGVLAMIILFFVYGGLAYLGATVSGLYPPGIDRVELLIAITGAILGDKGTVLLGILVCVACLTPAIGLLSSAASYFVKQSKGRARYEVLVVSFAAISCVISNFGITKILQLASPILNILYPILLLMIIMNLFRSKITNDYIYKFAAFGTVATSLVSIAEHLTGWNLSIIQLPFAQYGFQWIIPAVICGVLGACIPVRGGKLLGLGFGKSLVKDS